MIVNSKILSKENDSRCANSSENKNAERCIPTTFRIHHFVSVLLCRCAVTLLFGPCAAAERIKSCHGSRLYDKTANSFSHGHRSLSIRWIDDRPVHSFSLFMMSSIEMKDLLRSRIMAS